jgi:iron(III) transport system substrate-binding protein
MRSKLMLGLGGSVVFAAALVGISQTGVTSPATTAVAAKKESGLVIYGNPPPAQFKPVLDAFGKAYPQIKVSYSDQSDGVSFSKYRAEHAQHARTADIIIASSPVNWNNNRDIALNWTPTDQSSYPGYFKQYPGIFVFSPDPAVSLYSKAKLPGNAIPHSFSDLVVNLKKYPQLFKKKIATYTVNNDFGYSAFWGLVHKYGWYNVDSLGPDSKAQADGTAIATQIVTGASNYAFFESGLVRSALTGNVGKVAGWLYMTDFTPLIPRGVAITKGGASPNAAKTFLNWAFSGRLHGISPRCQLCELAGVGAKPHAQHVPSAIPQLDRQGSRCVRAALASGLRVSAGKVSQVLMPVSPA